MFGLESLSDGCYVISRNNLWLGFFEKFAHSHEFFIISHQIERGRRCNAPRFAWLRKRDLCIDAILFYIFTSSAHPFLRCQFSVTKANNTSPKVAIYWTACKSSIDRIDSASLPFSKCSCAHTAFTPVDEAAYGHILQRNERQTNRSRKWPKTFDCISRYVWTVHKSIARRRIRAVMLTFDWCAREAILCSMSAWKIISAYD